MENFYKGKRVLVTGHTGFKGGWMSFLLWKLGAIVTGVALEPTTEPSIFNVLNIKEKINSHIFDIRDLNLLRKVFDEFQPEIVIHLAAQPLVLDSYEDPVYTYDVNVMGTVNICECVRLTPSVKSFINVTTDKVYENKEWCYGYRENERLNGFDPYSNSKSCSELVTDSYINSFYKELGISVSRCRAGNVIGGGDFSNNRIIPDCVKFTIQGESIVIRNPNSTRPYQHVLEPVIFYLYLASAQFSNSELAGCYNIGPNEVDCLTTGEMVELFCESWGDGSNWINVNAAGPHEANYLKLDISKAKSNLNWQPVWNVKKAIDETVKWSKAFYCNEDMEKITLEQINCYLEEMKL